MLHWAKENGWRLTPASSFPRHESDQYGQASAISSRASAEAKPVGDEFTHDYQIVGIARGVFFDALEPAGHVAADAALRHTKLSGDCGLPSPCDVELPDLLLGLNALGALSAGLAGKVTRLMESMMSLLLRRFECGWAEAPLGSEAIKSRL